LAFTIAEDIQSAGEILGKLRRGIGNMMKAIGKVLVVFIVLLGAGIVAQVVRQQIAKVEIEREQQSVPSPVTGLGTTSHLEIIPLYEEDGDSQKFAIGHGVSYLIRTDEATILLDVGNNPDKAVEAPFLKNMRALNIAWDEIDFIVISHAHPDHTGGVDAWLQGEVRLGSQPVGLSAKPVYVPIHLKGSGLIMAQDPQPVLIAPGAATMGVLSYQEGLPFSLREPKGGEQALVIHLEGRGLVLITGCGHPTLERLVEQAEAVFGLPVVGVVGGLHYENFTQEDSQLKIQFLTERQPQLVALSPHDSSVEAIEAFQAAFPEQYRAIRVGEAIQFP
jgi:7,8-dihydropterin-6-yl-methyl-4-(beta-D-ribofuranosyl)aminobenzene 5'-phosphate synthase